MQELGKWFARVASLSGGDGNRSALARTALAPYCDEWGQPLKRETGGEINITIF